MASRRPSARTWDAGWRSRPRAPGSPGSNVQAPTIRLKVDDGVIVFPVSAKGRKVSAEGVFEALGEAGDSRDAAQEHAKDDPKASQSYQLKATGAIIQ